MNKREYDKLHKLLSELHNARINIWTACEALRKLMLPYEIEQAHKRGDAIVAKMNTFSRIPPDHYFDYHEVHTGKMKRPELHGYLR